MKKAIITAVHMREPTPPPGKMDGATKTFQCKTSQLTPADPTVLGHGIYVRSLDRSGKVYGPTSFLPMAAIRAIELADEAAK